CPSGVASATPRVARRPLTVAPGAYARSHGAGRPRRVAATREARTMRQGPAADAGGAATDTLVEAAVAAAVAGAASSHLDALVPRGAAGDGALEVDRALGRVLVEGVAGAWRRGWQPADLHRVVERRAGRRHARLAAVAIG